MTSTRRSICEGGGKQGRCGVSFRSGAAGGQFSFQQGCSAACRVCHGKGVGLEIQSALVEAAERNAVRLGVERRFSVVGGDVADAGCVRRLRACSGGDASPDALPLFDAVLCNPPWRREGAGRVPSSCMRRTALFGTEHTFPDFFSAADRLLKPSAVLMAVSGAERTTDLLAALPRRLRPERLRFVFTRQSAPATFVLLEARKNGRGTLRVERMEC